MFIAEPRNGRWFQFQNGSIKRKGSNMIAKALMEFQFQNGSIKRHEEIMFIQLLVSFNSKMVQLKGQITILMNLL